MDVDVEGEVKVEVETEKDIQRSIYTVSRIYSQRVTWNTCVYCIVLYRMVTLSKVPTYLPRAEYT